MNFWNLDMMVMKNGRLEATREEEAKEDEIEPKHHYCMMDRVLITH
jgi:hypothetical protein